jgi:sortase A
LGEPVSVSVRLIVRMFSELCLTAGTVIVLFSVYVLFWTGNSADSAVDGRIDRLRDERSRGPVPATAAPTAIPSRTSKDFPKLRPWDAIMLTGGKPEALHS